MVEHHVDIVGVGSSTLPAPTNLQPAAAAAQGGAGKSSEINAIGLESEPLRP